MFIIGCPQSELKEAVTAIGSDTAAIQGDISNLADLDRIYATVEAQAGHIDVPAVNAGFTNSTSSGRLPRSSSTIRSTRTTRSVHCAEGAAIAEQGLLGDLTGAIVSIKGFASCSVYNASKAAVHSFACTWIVDLKGRDIRVNVLSPGYTDTPGLSHFVTDQEKAAMVASVPRGRLGTPDDLGKAAVFLASDDSGYVTGIELFVDDGAAPI